MGVRIEWAEVGDLEIVREDDDVRDEHGTTLDPGNVGLAAGGCVIEGTPEELAAKLEELAAELRSREAVDAEVVEEPRALGPGLDDACEHGPGQQCGACAEDEGFGR